MKKLLLIGLLFLAGCSIGVGVGVGHGESMPLSSTKKISKVGHFTGTLIIEKQVVVRSWKVVVPFSYTPALPNTKTITVPVGFVTNFASVPRTLWVLFPQDGLYTQAAVLHDYLYSSKIYTRQMSDRIFLDAMKSLKVGAWTRNILYRAVRAFGFRAWPHRTIPK